MKEGSKMQSTKGQQVQQKKSIYIPLNDVKHNETDKRFLEFPSEMLQ